MTNIQIDLMQQEEDGRWVPAKEVCYQPSFVEKVKCAIGLHEQQKSNKYNGCTECFICGKRKTA